MTDFGRMYRTEVYIIVGASRKLVSRGLAYAICKPKRGKR